MLNHRIIKNARVVPLVNANADNTVGSLESQFYFFDSHLSDFHGSFYSVIEKVSRILNTRVSYNVPSVR